MTKAGGTKIGVARTTEIAAAYITGNTVAMADLGHLIETVGRALKTLGREDITPASARPAPAVPVRRSIREDALVCLVCGKRLKTIRRHLKVVHQLTPEAYRELFGLKPDYPWSQTKKHGVPRLRLLLGDEGATDRHDGGDDAVDPLGALVLGGPQVTSGVLGDRDVGGHPADDGIAAIGEPAAV